MSKSKFTKNLPTILMILGGLIIFSGLIYAFYPLFQQLHQQIWPPAQPIHGDFILNYQSGTLSDEELAGSLPTELNFQSGTFQQHLGEIDLSH